VHFWRFLYSILLPEKADVSAVKSYIRIKTPIEHTSMPPYRENDILPGHLRMIAKVVKSQLKDFVHNYVVSSAVKSHDNYTPQMLVDNELRVRVLTGEYTVGVFLGLMEQDPADSVLDVNKISRFQLLHPPQAMLDSLLALHKQDASRFSSIIHAPVRKMMRENTLHEWGKHHPQWRQHSQNAQSEDSRIHAHLKDSICFLEKLRQSVNGGH